MIIKIVKFIGKSFIEVFTPSKCVVCDEYIGGDSTYSEFLCNKCYDSIPYSPTHKEIFNLLLKAIPLEELYISKATSLFSVDIYQKNWLELIHLLKYNGITKIGTEFGKLLGTRLKSEKFLDYDFVVPIPIHKAKIRERGYNQADSIAKSVAQTINCKFDNKLIKRNKYTSSQTLLNSNERRINIHGVFGEYNSDSKTRLLNKKVLIIDDVLTTGSTMNECARELINLGCSKVDVATLAHA